MGLSVERAVISATMLGLARRALDDVIRFVREREQFGRRIGNLQAVRHRLADLSVEVECSRLLVRAVREAADEGTVPSKLSSLAKLKVTETARRVTLEAVQLMGAAGVTQEWGMELAARLALVSTIYGGTSEIQREILAEQLRLSS